MRSALLHPSLRLAALALALGLAGFAQAADRHDPRQASAAKQHDLRDVFTDGAARIDWNIDYPSQLGPKGPRSGADAQRKATIKAMQDTTSFAQPDAR